MDVKEYYRQYQKIDGWRDGTIADAMDEWCDTFSDRTCVVIGDESYTYSQIKEKIRLSAIGLQKLGIKKGDRVLLQLPNGINFIISYFGSIKAGAIPIMGLPAHRIGEIRGMIKTASPYLYISEESYMGFDYNEIGDVLKEEKLVEKVLVIEEEKSLIDELDVTGEYVRPDTDNLDIAFLSLSGGTTGMSKLIPRTHGDYLYDTYVSVKRCLLTGEDRVLVLLPLPHNFIIGHPGFLGTFMVGAQLIISEYPDMGEGLELIENERATFLSLVPSMAKLMLEILEEDDYDISSLRVVQIGGAFLEEQVADAMIDKGSFILQQVFGTAEGLNTMTALDDPREIVRCYQGKATSPYDVIRIADENDREVARGVYGELQIKGPYTIHAYYNYPDNDKCFTADGFYKTGDRAYLTEDGNLKLSGRIKEMINKGGEKITPSELETALADNDKIKDCAVVGLPDKELGEKIAVFVVTDEEIDLSGIREFLREKDFASFKLPDALFCVDALPLTKIGKVDKKRLIEIGKEN
ncbi:MAG: AMP-binding protein [Lachnospiraceae bacterium]|nr:AMP-binding protein [Lachnospiraceae bacterium]